MSNPRVGLLMVMVLSMLFAPVSAIAGEPQRTDDKVLARINNYTLTVADFESETRGKLPGGLSDTDLQRAREGLLDDLVTKKLLIQEAQKQNFDKDKAFIKEIEGYWEQALLKLLYKKRSQELVREIGSEEKDPRIRDVKVQQSLNTWIEELKNSADIKEYKENLKAVRP